MSQFYARYVPPTTTSEQPPQTAPQPEKRKRDDGGAEPDKTGKKRKKQDRDERALKSSKSTSDAKDKSQTAETTDTNSVLDKYRVTQTASREDPSTHVQVRRKDGIKRHKTNKATERADLITLSRPKQLNLAEADEQPLPPGAGEVQENNRDHDDVEEEAESRQKASPKREKRKVKVNQENEEEVEADINRRHAAMLSKFEKARPKVLATNDPEVVPGDESKASESLELHGLEPIPQPEQTEISRGKPTYPVLPSWQENPVHISSSSRQEFGSLGVSGILLENLRRHGLTEAFPVQAGMLPLLLEGDHTHRGDLCVSAATGSGKTLAYVVPMIAELSRVSVTKLRGVIVVPTRELVNQVRELCEACASGTRLRIATAVGSKSLKEEQDMLVVPEKIYDPEAYKREQESPVDWSLFSLRALVGQTNQRESRSSVNHITRYKSMVDILVTTPGRLVDHLRSTKGFHLDDVKWLVVDEADRLLNESYQEWIDVVTPALQSQRATHHRDWFLQSMRMSPPKRMVRKILLSATMTRDISKLNSLGLHKPKLLILGDGNTLESTTAHVSPDGVSPEGRDETRPITEANFHLPMSLNESVVIVADGSEKPLHLLTLIQNQLKKHSRSDMKTPSLSSESSSGSDSDSTSDSDSDVSSDTSLSTSSDDDSSNEDSSGSDKETPRRESFDRHRSRVVEASGLGRALIFTRSTASATRLSRLLGLLNPSLIPKISTLTRSTASSAASRKALSAFRKGKITILIATDRASRGLDVPDLEHVISYDVPNSSLTYVHRVGRTARAGKSGQAWTFVEHREAAWFWREIGGKGQRKTTSDGQIHRQNSIKRITLSIDDEALQEKYQEALQQLEEEVKR